MVCGALDHCFIKTHSIHSGGDLQLDGRCFRNLQIYFSVIFCKTRHHAQVHITSAALIHCALFLAARWTQKAAELGGWFRWPGLVVMTLQLHSVCCGHTWSSNHSGSGAILTFSTFFNQIPHQKEPEIMVGIFSPHEDNSIHLLDPEGGKTIS